MDRVQILLLAAGIGLLLFSWQFLGPPPAPPAPAPIELSEAERAHQAVERGLAPSTQPIQPGQASGRNGSPQPPATARAPRAVERSRVDLTQGESIVLENDVLRLEMSSLGGRFRSIELLGFNDRAGLSPQPVQLVTDVELGTGVVFLGGGTLAGLADVTHEIVSHDETSVTFRTVSSGVEVLRVLELDAAGFGARMRVSVANGSEQPVHPQFRFVWYGQERSLEAPDHFLNYQLVLSQDGEFTRRPIAGIQSSGFFGSLFGGGAPSGEQLGVGVEWAGMESQYFLLAAVSENPSATSGSWAPIGPESGLSSMDSPVIEIPQGRQVEFSYRLYMGPKTPDLVSAVDERLRPAAYVGWGWVRPFVDLFAYMLRWTYENLISNYGVAIVLLTILLRVVTFPLTQRSMKSMKKMGVIAPDMKILQEKYKEDPQRLQTEMSALYKRTGINPMTALGGGCLPMMLQMPFMLALYFALQGMIELRHAPFILWITDLSAPEDFFSIAGLPIRPLPLLMGLSMLGQQWLQPATGDAQQRKMMMWMNVAFIFMFYRFASGLVLYWFVSNLLGIAQQLLVNRPPADDAGQKPGEEK